MKHWLLGLKSSFTHPLAKGRQLDVLKKTYLFLHARGVSQEATAIDWINGLKLLTMSGGSGYFRNGLHEFADMMFAAHFLRPDDLFVDGGANVGTWSLLASGVIGCKAIAFEPAPATRRVLNANIALNGLESLITVQSCAIADQAGEAFMEAMGATNSVQKEQREDRSKVQLRRLDEVLVEQTPALIKLDLEGFEPNALRGAGELLSAKKVAAWSIEANSEDADQELTEIMTAAGYQRFLYDPIQRQLIPQRTSFLQYNLVFVRDVKETQERLQTAVKRPYFHHLV